MVGERTRGYNADRNPKGDRKRMRWKVTVGSAFAVLLCFLPLIPLLTLIPFFSNIATTVPESARTVLASWESVWEFVWQPVAWSIAIYSALAGVDGAYGLISRTMYTIQVFDRKKYNQWYGDFERFLVAIPNETCLTLIGHSVGASFLDRFLRENEHDTKRFPKVTFLSLGQLILRDNEIEKHMPENVKAIYLYREDDPFLVPKRNLSKHAERNPDYGILPSRGSPSYIGIHYSYFWEEDGISEIEKRLEFNRTQQSRCSPWPP